MSVRKWIASTVLVPCVCSLAAAAVPAAAAADGAWTVEDSVGVRYFVLNQFGVSPAAIGDVAGDPVVQSPDGKYFFFVSRHGDLATDSNYYVMDVYDARNVALALAGKRVSTETRVPPLRTLSFRSPRSEMFDAGIRDARWIDSREIVFLGIDGDAPRRVYRLNVESGDLQTLGATHDIIDVPSTGLHGGSVVYESVGELLHFRPLDEYPMVTIKGNELVQLLEGAPFDKLELYASYHAQPPRLLADMKSGMRGAWTSPDGRWVIAAIEPLGVAIPAEWTKYERAPKVAYQFELFDLEKKTRQSILQAPLGNVTNAGREVLPDVLWSPDSRHAILVNTALPLSAASLERVRQSYIVDVDVRTGSWSEIDSVVTEGGARVRSVSWLEDGKKLLVARELSEGVDAQGTVLTRTADRWIAQPARPGLQPPVQVEPAPLAQGLKVTLRESANDPPTMVAIQGKREIVLTNPDPALRNPRRARVEPVQWRESDGRIALGGLMLPPDASKPNRLPLVIQAFRYDPNRFRPDGPQFSAYAAQTLAANGFAVLTLDLPMYDHPEATETPREGPLFVDRIDSAVGELARQGLIDPARVAVVGFSRGGFMTYYALTHPGRVRLAAAVVADAFTGSYGEYVQDAATASSGTDQNMTWLGAYERQYGGGTFWQNKEKWLEGAPVFNVDRVQAPVLFSVAGKINKILMLETLAAFRICHKPYEFVYLPNGAHQLQRPRERQQLMQRSIDWISFWLQDKTTSSATADEERISRWQRMKASSMDRADLSDVPRS